MSMGVLRPIIAIADFNEKLLKPLMKGLEGRLLIFAPDLDTKRKIAPVDPTLVIETPYVAPGIPPITRDEPGRKRGLFSYTSGGIGRYAAFQWMQQPRALAVVETPLRTVLAPIRHIQYAAVVVALIMVPLIWVLAGFALRPLLFNLRACLQFAGAPSGRGILKNGSESTAVTMWANWPPVSMKWPNGWNISGLP